MLLLERGGGGRVAEPEVVLLSCPKFQKRYLHIGMVIEMEKQSLSATQRKR